MCQIRWGSKKHIKLNLRRLINYDNHKKITDDNIKIFKKEEDIEWFEMNFL